MESLVDLFIFSMGYAEHLASDSNRREGVLGKTPAAKFLKLHTNL